MPLKSIRAAPPPAPPAPPATLGPGGSVPPAPITTTPSTRFRPSLGASAGMLPEPDAPAASPAAPAFPSDVLAQIDHILRRAIGRLARQRSHFRVDAVLQEATVLAGEELPATILQNPAFAPTLATRIHDQGLMSLDNHGAVTTPEMLEEEQQMLGFADARDQRHVLPEAIVDRVLSRKRHATMAVEQRDAFLAATRQDRRVCVIEGAAGSGKSVTMRAIKEAYEAAGYDIVGVALSWNAANVLMESAGLTEISSIESLVRAFFRARECETDYFRRPTLVIVDEAGMVGVNKMWRILSETAASQHPIKVVLTGDSLQVNPVEPGNALEAIVAKCGSVRLSEIRRQHRPSQRVAVTALSRREAGRALAIHDHQENLRWCRDHEAMLDRVAEDYLSLRLAHPDATVLIVALSNKDVQDLNNRIRRAYRQIGVVDSDEVLVRVTDGREQWDAAFAIGDEVEIRANDREAVVYAPNPADDLLHPEHWVPLRRGIHNRNHGRVVALRPAPPPARRGSHDLIVELEGERPGRVVLNTQALHHGERRGFPVTHNFATTIYGSQGRTVDHALLVDHPRMNFRLAYVGSSRHRQSLRIYLDEEEIHHRMDSGMSRTRTPLPRRGEPAPVRDAAEGTPRGRYTRSEMLRCVAATWANDSRNETLFMRDRRARYGEETATPREVLSALVLDGTADPAADAPAATPIPQVDLPALLAATPLPPDGIHHRDPDALAARNRPDGTAAPTRSAAVLPGAMLDHEGVLGKAARWLRQRRGTPSGQGFSAPENMVPASHPDADAPFGTRSLPVHATAVISAPCAVMGGRARPGRAVPDLKRIPWRPHVDTVGRGHSVKGIDFTNVPGTRNGTPPDPAIVLADKGEHWMVGPEGEPRVLARDTSGRIAARYRLDGTCVAGNGFPPLWINRKAKVTTPVLIVPGPMEAWRLLAHLHAKHANDPDPSRHPHVIWAARDANWARIAKPLADSTTVIVVRSRQDADQEAWARSLVERLQREVGITPSVRPALPPEAPRRTTTKPPPP